MKEILESVYRWLYEGQTLQTVGLVVGVALIVSHAIALMKVGTWIERLKTVPRSQQIGMIVLTIDFIWAYMVVSSMDLGEFYKMRWLAQMAIPAFFVGLLFIANDYLGARAIGIFMLLAACPVLDAAFQKPPVSRLFLSALAYVWLTFGLFWVGMPFTMRDQIAWVTKVASRYKGLAVAGVAYGVMLIGIALTAYKGY